MNIKELIKELQEQKEDIKKNIAKLKHRYINEVLNDYDAFQIKYLIGYYEGQEDIINQILDYYKN